MQQWLIASAQHLVLNALGYVPCSLVLAACRYDEHAWECTSCGHLLLTAHRLDLHVQEVHDSFFQAQAARSMKVKRMILSSVIPFHALNISLPQMPCSLSCRVQTRKTVPL